MGTKTKKLEEILNVGIGAVKTSQEVWEKLMTDLNSKKEDISTTFSKLKQEGENDYSDPALKVKVGTAWGIVKFDEIKDNIVSFLDKHKDEKEK
ncbi:MAG: hypothetical protein JJT78_06485 [Leptospira sp.]|nr:hypothetical protein [Leptospira sp.]